MRIVSYGGGTNSTAMLIECVNRGIAVDLILFADTGGEKPHTYNYVKIFSDWLVAHDMPEITTVGPIFPQQIKDGSLEQECLRLGVLPSRTYGYGSCSMKWKRDPQERYINNWQQAIDFWRTGQKITKLIGMDAEEPQRAERLLALKEEKYSYECPLVDWDMGRDECIETIEKAGLCLPGKSACFYCPSSKISEIRQLAANYPDLMQRAIAMEENADTHTIKGLGRQFSWADVISTSDMFPDDFSQTPEMACGCYDGD